MIKRCQRENNLGGYHQRVGGVLQAADPIAARHTGLYAATSLGYAGCFAARKLKRIGWQEEGKTMIALDPMSERRQLTIPKATDLGVPTVKWGFKHWAVCVLLCHCVKPPGRLIRYEGFLSAKSASP